MNTDEEKGTMEIGRRTDTPLLSMEKIQELVSMVYALYSVLGIIGRTNANDSDGNF